MPSTKSIKQRIRSTKNIGQITKAMEVVSATKMRRSQEFALRARPYAAASLEMLQNLLARTPEELMPALLKARPVKSSALMVVTSDKGLAGAFNANVLKKAEARINAVIARSPEPSRGATRQSRGSAQDHGIATAAAGGLAMTESTSFAFVTVGKKARDYFQRRGVPVQRSFIGFGDYSTLEDTLPVADLILQGFLEGEWDAVEAVYMNFRTTLLQEVVVKKILPATRESIEEAVASILPERGRYADLQPTAYNLQPLYNYEYKFEPSPTEILNVLVPQLLHMHVHHIILESNASEHSARMVAMKNASDNAGELIHNLTLAYNKARQANITSELVEITAGKEALEA